MKTEREWLEGLRLEDEREFYDRNRLHAAISDAVWLERYSDIMESTCEIADLVLEALGYEPYKDGVGPWPHHHDSVLMQHLSQSDVRRSEKE